MKFAGVEIKYNGKHHEGQDSFEIRANEKRILITFGDHLRILDNIESFDIVFRYHYWAGRHVSEKFYPITPISFHSWRQYHSLKGFVDYKCNSDIVLNNQEPKANALFRRENVQEILASKYKNKLDTTITSQTTYWMKLNNCLVSVCVPGARPDILDRGQIQQWAFGGCTISPFLKATLPGFIIPKPGTHYIECKLDYSDLIEKIEWCRENREKCIEIGRNAKKLFEETCLPGKVLAWISENIKE
jgi:hypothetical protein